ncbi:MAG: M20/M25/M40 family metallo-hydrolase [Verrucomicrobiales bacterium]|nr:M20/M25/M40 family metallo-hydrolase [Verrucomicrobiales bacterium]
MEQPAISEELLQYQKELKGLREILFANIVMAGEIPAPTGGEQMLTRFLSDRFTESGLNDIAFDQAGNIAAVLPGRNPGRNLLLAAHVDKVWNDSDDHTVSVEVGRMGGRGLADNALGVATLATMPIILERLNIKLESNLILLGTTRSFGRGNLGGMRFFLENTDRKFESALCLEGMNLGRLSFSSLGMARGEISIEWSGEGERPDVTTTGVISTMQEVLHELIRLNGDSMPGLKILIGAVNAGSGYNVPPVSGRICFEIRSEEAEAVAAMEQKLFALADRFDQVSKEIVVGVEMIAHRSPGNLGDTHPLVEFARGVLETLDVRPKVEPSISELAALLTHRIPSLTLGLTRGSHRHSPGESIELSPLFSGLAQLLAVLRYMDRTDQKPF